MVGKKIPRSLTKPNAPKWESNEIFVKTLDADLIETYLEWIPVHYEKSDWDNIPPLVAKYCI